MVLNDHIVTINGNLYYIYDGESYMFNKANETWNQVEWVGPAPEYGSNVWTDGTNIYYSSGAKQYMLNVKS